MPRINLGLIDALVDDIIGLKVKKISNFQEKPKFGNIYMQ